MKEVEEETCQKKMYTKNVQYVSVCVPKILQRVTRRLLAIIPLLTVVAAATGP